MKHSSVAGWELDVSGLKQMPYDWCGANPSPSSLHSEVLNTVPRHLVTAWNLTIFTTSSPCFIYIYIYIHHPWTVATTWPFAFIAGVFHLQDHALHPLWRVGHQVQVLQAHCLQQVHEEGEAVSGRSDPACILLSHNWQAHFLFSLICFVVKIWNRNDCWRSKTRSKHIKRSEVHYLLGQKRHMGIFRVIRFIKLQNNT